MLEKGKISFGKYTFVRILAFPASDALTSLIEDEINCQNTTPAETHKKLSVKFWEVSIRKESPPKIKILINGRITDQPKPTQVCLYLTKISRRERYLNKPLYLFNSVKLKTDLSEAVIMVFIYWLRFRIFKICYSTIPNSKYFRCFPKI